MSYSKHLFQLYLTVVCSTIKWFLSFFSVTSSSFSGKRNARLYCSSLLNLLCDPTMETSLRGCSAALGVTASAVMVCIEERMSRYIILGIFSGLSCGWRFLFKGKARNIYIKYTELIDTINYTYFDYCEIILLCTKQHQIQLWNCLLVGPLLHTCTTIRKVSALWRHYVWLWFLLCTFMAMLWVHYWGFESHCQIQCSQLLQAVRVMS